MAITTLACAGDNIVVASGVSEATRDLFEHRLPSMGINATFIESGFDDHVMEAIDPNTKAIFAESISTYDLLVSNFETLSQVAHRAGLPLVMLVCQTRLSKSFSDIGAATIPQEPEVTSLDQSMLEPISWFNPQPNGSVYPVRIKGE